MNDEPEELITALEYRLLTELIYEFCGIRFEEAARYMVTRRLHPRLRDLGLQNFTDYYRYLKYNPRARQELDELVERVTTNETYFFREDYQLRAFTDEIIPELAASHAEDKRIRIWSAGCSSGEEAYTIAILCSESPHLRGYHIEIFGNDISKKVLAMARSARYPIGAFRATDKRHLERYFRRVDGGKYELVDEIKQKVTFGHLNLLDSLALSLVGQNDVIFCRNVMIYFDEPVRKTVLKNLYRRLRPRGYLLLGHSESLLNVTTEFEVLALKNDLVYRRPGA
jgi:chemotaxis protein methyltransferase CheR